MSTLGGYDPQSGRNAHEADKPTLIPVPSLLRSLLSDHLDPGYAAAAEARAADGKGRTWWQASMWQICGALVIAVVFAAAVAQARSTAPGVRETQHVLAGSVKSAQATTNDATAQRNALAAQVDTERRSRLEGDERGQQLLGSLPGELRCGRHTGDRAWPDHHCHRSRDVQRPHRRLEGAPPRQQAGHPGP